MLVIVTGMMLLSGGPSGRAGTPLWCFMLPLDAALLRGLVQPAVKLGLASWPGPFAATLIANLVPGDAAGRCHATANAKRRASAGQRAPWHLWLWAVGVTKGMAQLLLFTALSRGPVALVAPLVASSPLVTLAFGRWLPWRRPMPRWRWWACASPSLGIMLLLAA